mmetsp:Transcript_4867/g.8688  ORF Transcript_4867/g.8688 Transcript_4867/m.8688 type:complete len:222 (+) Transcript_4867:294-959(+)
MLNPHQASKSVTCSNSSSCSWWSRYHLSQNFSFLIALKRHTALETSMRQPTVMPMACSLARSLLLRVSRSSSSETSPPSMAGSLAGSSSPMKRETRAKEEAKCERTWTAKVSRDTPSSRQAQVSATPAMMPLMRKSSMEITTSNTTQRRSFCVVASCAKNATSFSLSDTSSVCAMLCSMASTMLVTSFASPRGFSLRLFLPWLLEASTRNDAAPAVSLPRT